MFPFFRLGAQLFLRYPRESLLVIVATLVASILEGVGMATMMPLLATISEPGVASSNQLQRMVEWLFQQVGFEPTIVSLFAIICVAMIGKAAILFYAMGRVAATIAAVSFGFRDRYLAAILGANWQFFTDTQPGTVANALALESQNAATCFSSMAKLVALGASVAVYLLLAAAISLPTTFLAMAAGVLLFFVLRVFVSRARAASNAAVRAYNDLLGLIVDLLAGFKSIKVMNREDDAAAFLHDSNKRLADAQRRISAYKEWLVISQEPFIIVFVAILVVALIDGAGHTLGEVLMLAVLFYRTATKLGQTQSLVQRVASSESFLISVDGKIARAESMKQRTEGGVPPVLSKAIRLDRVSVNYGGTPVLKDISLEIPAGCLSLVHGPSGAGKSTIVDAISGLIKPSEGAVLVDGQPLSGLDLRAWRSEIGYVQQELFLFHDTVFNNLVIGARDVGQDEIRRALELAGAAEFVDRLPSGVHTVVGERGLRLSGGQRQRLSIARALVKRPRLLILDEPTTALDPATEKEICQTLSNLRGEVTLVAISHQPTLAQYADVVHSISDGRLLESKTLLRGANS